MFSSLELRLQVLPYSVIGVSHPVRLVVRNGLHRTSVNGSASISLLRRL
jgi:hypothetical protein